MTSNDASNSSLRLRFFPVIWAFLLPVRAYLRHFPIQHGKGLLLRRGIMPLLPPGGATYDLQLPSGGSVRLQYRETLGLSSLLYGTFEHAELRFASRYLQCGDVAFDIGANVGIFSIVMGRATGHQGGVVAFEPVPFNVARLKENLERNLLRHVRVQPIAVGKSEDEMAIHLASDSAYHSLGPVEKPFSSERTLTVPVRKLDDMWRELGGPKVKFLKIDVEGAEADVLSGGVEFLRTCQPVVLIEANSTFHLERLMERFTALGFECFKPPAFVAHNYLFFPPEAKGSIMAAFQ